MKFRLKADAWFEARDWPEAFRRLAEHFRHRAGEEAYPTLKLTGRSYISVEVRGPLGETQMQGEVVADENPPPATTLAHLLGDIRDHLDRKGDPTAGEFTRRGSMLNDAVEWLLWQQRELELQRQVVVDVKIDPALEDACRGA